MNHAKTFFAFLYYTQPGLIPFSVFCFLFSVKKVRIISKLKLKFVAFETELGSKAYPSAYPDKILFRITLDSPADFIAVATSCIVGVSFDGLESIFVKS